MASANDSQVSTSSDDLTSALNATVITRFPTQADIDANKKVVETLKLALRKQERRMHLVNYRRDMFLRKLNEKFQAKAGKAISGMERTQAKKVRVEEKQRSVMVQRDAALADLRNVEQAFSDVHRKYERAKKILECLKRNEEMLKERDEQIQDKIIARDRKVLMFACEIDDTVQKLYADYKAQSDELENDNIALAAFLRRSELRVETLESELEQKQKENEQLNNLADELVGKKKRSKDWGGS